MSAAGSEAARQRYLLLDYDEMCRDPDGSIPRFLAFLGVVESGSAGLGTERFREVVARLRALVQPKASNSIGRFREYGTAQFDPADVAYTAQLGFPTK